jgi:pyruvate,water dikinase
MAIKAKNDYILLLSKWVKNIEDYYSTLYNKWCPMDIEWAFDGNKLYIIQARPETIHSKKNAYELLEYKLKLDGSNPKVIVKGIAVGTMIGSGKVRKIHSLHSLHNKV